MHGLIQDVAFHVWLLLLNVTPLRFIQTVFISSSFFKVFSIIPLYGYTIHFFHFSIHELIDNFDYFSLAIMNKDAMNIFTLFVV